MEPRGIESPSMEGLNRENKEIKSVLLFLIVTSFVQLFIVGIYTYSAVVDREARDKQEALNRELRILVQQYNRQDNKYKEIEYPLIAVHAVLDEIRKKCTTEKSSTNNSNSINEKRQELIKHKVELVQAFGASQIVFGDELFSQIRNFVINLEKNEALNNQELCKIDTIYYIHQLKQEGNNIDQLMFNSMDNTRKKMEAISSDMH